MTTSFPVDIADAKDVRNERKLSGWKRRRRSDMSLTVHEAVDESAHTPRVIFVRQHAVLIWQIILLRITLMIAMTGPI